MVGSLLACVTRPLRFRTSVLGVDHERARADHQGARVSHQGAGLPRERRNPRAVSDLVVESAAMASAVVHACRRGSDRGGGRGGILSGATSHPTGSNGDIAIGLDRSKPPALRRGLAAQIGPGAPSRHYPPGRDEEASPVLVGQTRGPMLRSGSTTRQEGGTSVTSSSFSDDR